MEILYHSVLGVKAFSFDLDSSTSLQLGTRKKTVQYGFLEVNLFIRRRKIN